jgi:hypothetical protein
LATASSWNGRSSVPSRQIPSRGRTSTTVTNPSYLVEMLAIWCEIHTDITITVCTIATAPPPSPPAQFVSLCRPGLLCHGGGCAYGGCKPRVYPWRALLVHFCQVCVCVRVRLCVCSCVCA